ncbi:hypothetical protein Tsubulata_022489 [Turnera subulata]|uniref:SHSP domain-containing protein n=1 Tax=Turnera subulata TaxID=218843 RepID=A0A9Q0FLH8_9ROSI|nr:hypothetical protein Tsubulata_022489 [Turnera subulata]
MSIIRHRVPYSYSPFKFDVFDPFHDLHHGGGGSSSPLSTFFNNGPTAPLMSIKMYSKETPEEYVYRADLPGLGKDEVKVEVEGGNVLRITGQRVVEKEEKSDGWYHMERSGGKFVRCFGLPENAKADKMKTSMEDGVLTITVPKKEMSRKMAKPIPIY